MKISDVIKLLKDDNVTPITYHIRGSCFIGAENKPDFSLLVRNRQAKPGVFACDVVATVKANSSHCAVDVAARMRIGSHVMTAATSVMTTAASVMTATAASAASAVITPGFRHQKKQRNDCEYHQESHDCNQHKSVKNLHDWISIILTKFYFTKIVNVI